MSRIRDLHKLLTEKKISCKEMTTLFLRHGEAMQPGTNAYVRFTPEAAFQAAESADSRLARGESLKLLEGIPMALKDNLSTKGIPTTCCSKMLETYTPVYDAFVWDCLKKEGAVLLGKTNMDEFAMGASGETSLFGAARNPYDPACTAGGSSGGSACAVSAGTATYSLGTDTGGSIRQPASFCGVVGLKPTYGAVSRNGLIAYASSMDQAGPIAACVEDVSILYDTVAKKDPLDSTCRGAAAATQEHLSSPLPTPLRIGILREQWEQAEDVDLCMEAAVKIFETLDAKIEFVSFPSIKDCLPAYYILACGEASSNLGRYDGIRFGTSSPSGQNWEENIQNSRRNGFGQEVKRRILLGTHALSSGYYQQYYGRALTLREELKKALASLFETYHLLLSPTVPVPAFPLGVAQKDPAYLYQMDICTVPANLAGIPALSLPCGFSRSGLPIGLQLLGKWWEEALLLQAGWHFEKELQFPVRTSLQELLQI